MLYTACTGVLFSKWACHTRLMRGMLRDDVCLTSLIVLLIRNSLGETKKIFMTFFVSDFGSLSKAFSSPNCLCLVPLFVYVI